MRILKDETIPQQDAPGSSALLRTVIDSHVSVALPVIVVRDTDDLLVTYVAAGTAFRRRQGVRGGPRNRVMLAATGKHEDVIWRDNHRLILYRPGDHYSVSLFRSAGDDRLLDWYVDLNEPWRRTRHGFDTRDLVLDVVFSLDRTQWTWKDEDEFAWRQEQGMMSAEKARAIRDWGKQAIDEIVSGRYPIDPAWARWRPDPDRPIPELPNDWQVIEPVSP